MVNVARAPFYRVPEMSTVGWVLPTVLFSLIIKLGGTCWVRVLWDPPNLPYPSCCQHFRGKSPARPWKRRAVATQQGHLAGLRQNEGGSAVSLLPSPGWLGWGGLIII